MYATPQRRPYRYLGWLGLEATIRGIEPQDASGDTSEIERVFHEWLHPRERYVLAMRYGLDVEGRCRTLVEVAREAGVSRERIRQIELDAIAKLRRCLSRISGPTCTGGPEDRSWRDC